MERTLQAQGLDGTNGILASRAGAFHEQIDFLQAQVAGQP